MTALILATRNEHKRREFAQLLAPHEILTPADDVTLPPEDGDSYAENALGKARAVARATGRAAIADDSGIEARALGGRPGIRSARYAGDGATDAENLDKLLREVPPGDPLRYVCALVLVEPGGEERVFEGTCDGRRAERAAGEGGFGYDPAFVPDDLDDGRTMAQLTQGEKDAISHRGRAARALLDFLSAHPTL